MSEDTPNEIPVPIRRILEVLVKKAEQDGANRIIISKVNRRCKVNQMIDGEEVEVMTIPGYIYPLMCSYIKQLVAKGEFSDEQVRFVE